MLLFLDTEFTDFVDCDLISIGMVSEDGQHVFYAERKDYARLCESEFVRQAVLPHLGQFPEAVCTYDELKTRLRTWFAMLPRHVQIGCDSMHDRNLLRKALDGELPANLDSSTFDLAALVDTIVFHQAACRYHGQPGKPWHHSLYDALAHGACWLAWQDAKRMNGFK